MRVWFASLILVVATLFATAQTADAQYRRVGVVRSGYGNNYRFGGSFGYSSGFGYGSFGYPIVAAPVPIAVPIVVGTPIYAPALAYPSYGISYGVGFNNYGYNRFGVGRFGGVYRHR